MFEHAVVAVDFSPNWPALRDRLPRLRKAGIGRLTLVHVMARGLPGTASQDAEMAEECHSALQKAGELLVEHGFSVGHEVLVGEPAVAIDDYLEQTDASLVVAGSHGHGPLHAFFLGSTIHDLARAAGRPIWLEPLDQEPYEDGPLLLATNASAGARNAERFARQLQPAYGTGIALLVDEGNGKPEQRQAERHVRETLPGFTLRLEHGKAAPVINTVAREANAALVLLGRSSHGSLRDLLWGSTAEHLCRRPPTSILLIPAAPP